MERKIYFISNCINGIDYNEFSTSSQKYEYCIALALSRFEKVTILSTEISQNVKCVDGNFSIVGIKRKQGISCDLLRANIEHGSIVIFYGYSPKIVKVMLRLRKENIIVPIVFDHHGPALRKCPLWKKIIVYTMLNYSMKQIKKFHGCVLFQEEAKRILKIKSTCHISKPGVLFGEKNQYSYNSSKFIVLFAGTLSTLNKIDVLLKAFNSLNDNNIELHIYGYGELEDEVVNAAKYNKNIKFFGEKSNKELETAYKNVSLFVVLRDPKAYSMNFSFPSKLFECMNTGIPVLTTKLLSDEIFKESVFLIDSITETAVRNKIMEAFQKREQLQEIGKKAKQYVESNFSYEKMAEAIYEYLLKIVKKNEK